MDLTLTAKYAPDPDPYLMSLGRIRIRYKLKQILDPAKRRDNSSRRFSEQKNPFRSSDGNII